MLRAILAICVLLPALYLVRLAQWICPELKQQQQALQKVAWLDSPQDWESKVN